MTVHSDYASKILSTEFRFTSTDGLSVACARWDSCSPVRGVVQIAHGMGEHIERYLGLIEFLASTGLTVYGNDPRGHCRTAPSATHFGDFGEGGFGEFSASGKKHPECPLRAGADPVRLAEPRQRSCRCFYPRLTVLCTTSAGGLCIAIRDCAPTVGSKQPSQDTQRFAHLPLFGQRRSCWPATRWNPAPDRAISQGRYLRHLPRYLPRWATRNAQ